MTRGVVDGRAGAPGWADLVGVHEGNTVSCRAPAKVNLTLAVLGRRPDGFHEIESWVVKVGLFDDLVFAPASALSLTVRGDHTSRVPEDASNLTCLAAVALAEAASRSPTVEIRLRKRVPVAAGLGGGSADAAATLAGLNKLWGLHWPVRRLAAIAEGLGSDVPLFLEPGSAVIRGRGERIERLSTCWEGWLALVVPSYGLTTEAVYRHLRRRDPPRSADMSETPAGRRCHRLETPARGRCHRAVWAASPCSTADVSARLFNDLEASAFALEPRLARLHAALDGLEGRSVRMTGSGSCLFAVFDSQSEAQHWRQRAGTILEPGDKTYVVKTR